MKATRLEGHATTWLVDGNSFQCSRPGCNYARSTPKDLTGEVCPRCATDWRGDPGRLERRQHQVDTAAFCGVGSCGCEAFTFGWHDEFVCPPPNRAGHPYLSRLSPALLGALPQALREANRCPHIKAARLAQGKGDGLDALLMALPN